MVLPLPVRVNLVAMAMKKYSKFPQNSNITGTRYVDTVRKWLITSKSNVTNYKVH